MFWVFMCPSWEVWIWWLYRRASPWILVMNTCSVIVFFRTWPGLFNSVVIVISSAGYWPCLVINHRKDLRCLLCFYHQLYICTSLPMLTCFYGHLIFIFSWTLALMCRSFWIRLKIFQCTSVHLGSLIYNYDFCFYIFCFNFKVLVVLFLFLVFIIYII